MPAPVVTPPAGWRAEPRSDRARREERTACRTSAARTRRRDRGLPADEPGVALFVTRVAATVANDARAARRAPRSTSSTARRSARSCRGSVAESTAGRRRSMTPRSKSRRRSRGATRRTTTTTHARHRDRRRRREHGRGHRRVPRARRCRSLALAGVHAALATLDPGIADRERGRRSRRRHRRCPEPDAPRADRTAARPRRCRTRATPPLPPIR